MKMLGIARCSAKKRGIEFNIDVNDVLPSLARGACDVTGLAFDFGPSGPWRPSLDRIKPNRGYVKGNVQVVVWIYNTAKQQYSHEDVITLANAVLSRSQKGIAS